MDGEVGLAVAIGVARHKGVGIALFEAKLAGMMGEAITANKLKCLVSFFAFVGIDGVKIDQVALSCVKIGDRIGAALALGRLSQFEEKAVGTLATGQRILAQAAIDRIRAIASDDDVGLAETLQNIVAAVAGQRVGEHIARTADVAGPRQGQFFDECSKAEIDRSFHRVDALILQFLDQIACIVDDIAVVAIAAIKLVGAELAVECILAGIAAQDIVMRRTRERVVALPIAAGVLYPAFGLLLSPITAAAAMALSSASVSGNALSCAPRAVKLIACFRAPGQFGRGRQVRRLRCVPPQVAYVAAPK